MKLKKKLKTLLPFLSLGIMFISTIVLSIDKVNASEEIYNMDNITLNFIDITGTTNYTRAKTYVNENIGEYPYYAIVKAGEGDMHFKQGTSYGSDVYQVYMSKNANDLNQLVFRYSASSVYMNISLAFNYTSSDMIMRNFYNTTSYNANKLKALSRFDYVKDKSGKYLTKTTTHNLEMGIETNVDIKFASVLTFSFDNSTYSYYTHVTRNGITYADTDVIITKDLLFKTKETTYTFNSSEVKKVVFNFTVPTEEDYNFTFEIESEDKFEIPYLTTVVETDTRYLERIFLPHGVETESKKYSESNRYVLDSTIYDKSVNESEIKIYVSLENIPDNQEVRVTYTYDKDTSNAISYTEYYTSSYQEIDLTGKYAIGLIPLMRQSLDKETVTDVFSNIYFTNAIEFTQGPEYLEGEVKEVEVGKISMCLEDKECYGNQYTLIGHGTYIVSDVTYNYRQMIKILNGYHYSDEKLKIKYDISKYQPIIFETQYDTPTITNPNIDEEITVTPPDEMEYVTEENIEDVGNIFDRVLSRYDLSILYITNLFSIFFNGIGSDGQEVIIITLFLGVIYIVIRLLY